MFHVAFLPEREVPRHYGHSFIHSFIVQTIHRVLGTWPDPTGDPHNPSLGHPWPLGSQAAVLAQRMSPDQGRLTWFPGAGVSAGAESHLASAWLAELWTQRPAVLELLLPEPTGVPGWRVTLVGRERGGEKGGYLAALQTSGRCYF